MFNFLKNHPFAVEAFFESSLVLTYAVPREQLQPLLPECLEADVFGERWAFLAVAMVQTQGLRPKGFPKILGHDFFLVGYRIFVRYTSEQGKRLRGLYILRSETDKKKMEFFGNIFTHYKYSTTDISLEQGNGSWQIRSAASAFTVSISDGEPGPIALPAGSPFADWKEARRFAGPLPFTFTYNRAKKEVLVIEGVRQNWKPVPVRVLDHHFSFIDDLGLNGVQLANAFLIKNIPYYWKKGRTELWKQKEQGSRVS